MGEAASEKVPGSEKGPDRTTASGRACGRNGCPAGRAEGGAPQASGEGEATRTVGDRHCFLHWLRGKARESLMSPPMVSFYYRC